MTLLSTRLFQLQLLVTQGYDYPRCHRYVISLVKSKVCSIPPLIPEGINLKLVKIDAHLKIWRLIQMLNSAFPAIGLRLPLLVTTSLSTYRQLKYALLNSFRHMTLDALTNILSFICTFASYAYRRVHIILQSTSFYWCDTVRQNVVLNATLSKYLVDSERFSQCCIGKETH